jgi:hypothetical protein
MSHDITNFPLIAGAAMSGIAALLHLGIIVGGATWYQFYGAGERMAHAAQAGRWYPSIVTLCIAAVLAIAACYALSGAGLMPRLPGLQIVLVVITAVYLLRGLVGLGLLWMQQRTYSKAFIVWSSLVCLAMGGLHLWGMALVWPLLAHL